MALDKNELYPRLASFLALKGMTLKPAFTLQDVATMFDVSVRTIQTWITSGHLNQRKIPGRATIFPVDLESLFAVSDPANPAEGEASSKNLASPSSARPNSFAHKTYPTARR